jgi:hypothetical protein
MITAQGKTKVIIQKKTSQWPRQKQAPRNAMWGQGGSMEEESAESTWRRGKKEGLL